MPIPLESNNSAFGYAALGANTTADYKQRLAFRLLMPIPLEEVIQRLAFNANTTGGNNSAFGHAALYVNTTGRK
jgi:hypothetical protein